MNPRGQRLRGHRRVVPCVVIQDSGVAVDREIDTIVELLGERPSELSFDGGLASTCSTLAAISIKLFPANGVRPVMHS